MIVANRCLKLRQAETELNVVVRVFAPQPNQVHWTCECEIEWPEGTRKFAAHGVDSMQALLLALNMIGSEIYTSDHHKAGSLAWGKPQNGYGFPVPQNLRDLLIGDDAEFL